MLDLKPFIARDPEQPNRTATQLELFFDLVAVIAIAAATHEFRHALSSGHGGEGLLLFLSVFFMIWWPWQQYTWFSSSFDNDDTVQRLHVMVFMVGFMGIAASVPLVFAAEEHGSLLLSYGIMRLVQISLWRRVARHNERYRKTAYRYIGALAASAIYWAGATWFAFHTQSPPFGIIAVGFALELTVPLLIKGMDPTPWHREHIIERYGLMMIITLGEILLYSVEAVRVMIQGHADPRVGGLAVCGILITFCLWSLYFSGREHLAESGVRQVFSWSYGHFLIFTAVAGTGTGLGVSLDVLLGEAEHASATTATAAISVPTAVALLGLWAVRARMGLFSNEALISLALAGLVGLSGLLPGAPATTVACLFLALVLHRRSAA